jgi:hypothetical protein
LGKVSRGACSLQIQKISTLIDEYMETKASEITTKFYRKDVTVTRRTQKRALVDGDQY